MARGTVLAQNKDYRGKLSKPVMDKILDDFNNNTKELESKGKSVKCYQINGGDGLTKGAQESFDNFSNEVGKNGKFSIYLTNEQVNKLNNSLNNKVSNKNKNKA